MLGVTGRPPTEAAGKEDVMHAFKTPRSLALIGRFGAHVMEMCVAMCLGALTLNVLIWGGAALLGYKNLFERFPELSALVITLTLSLPMVAWMRFRGHDWQHALEMSGATVLVGVLLIAGFWLGIVSQSGLIEWQIRLACPVMVAVMLLRAGFYSRNHASHHSTVGVR
jgi:hypothetical protein